MSPVILRWLLNEDELSRMEGSFGLVLYNNIMKVSGNLVKRPREERKRCHWQKDQTAKPELHEGTSLRLFFDDLCCEITFSSVSEAIAYRDIAMKPWLKKSSAPSPVKAPEPAVPKPAPEPARKRPKVDDGGFMLLSSQNQLITHRASDSESLSSKRRALDSRVETKSPERPVVRPTLLKRAPQRTTLLQRRASNPLQDSSIYHSYRSSLAFGLQNLGNTCYLNAVTQAVGSAREFVADLTSMSSRWPHCTNGPLFKCTVDILQRLQETQNAPLSPAKLREQIAVSAPMFRGSGQQDAHEFFLEYINQLHDELLRGHKEWQARNAEDQEVLLATQNHFDAELLKQLTCTKCGQSRQVTERFRDFSLDFGSDDSRSSVAAMFRNYFDPELVEAKCDHCQTPSAQLESQLSEAPGVLVLHLKRFVPNMEKQCYEKQHQSVQIPYTLNLGSLFGKSGTSTGSSPPRLPARPLASAAALAAGMPDADAEALVYNLRAVVCHEGSSPRSGHYVCYAESAKGDWYLYDDSRVKQFSKGEEPWTTLGSKAYMLFYVLGSPEMSKEAAAA